MVSIGSIVLSTRQYADRVLVIDDGSTLTYGVSSNSAHSERTADRTAEVAELAGGDAIDDHGDAGGVFYGVYGDYIAFDVKVGQ